MAIAGNQISRLLIEQRLRQLARTPGRSTASSTRRRGARSAGSSGRDLPVTGYAGQATVARLLAP
jgi:hypothetical protein